MEVIKNVNTKWYHHEAETGFKRFINRDGWEEREISRQNRKTKHKAFTYTIL